MTLPGIILMLLTFLSFACGSSPAEPGDEVIPAIVGPDRVDCVVALPQKCLIVDGELFYEEIEGFQHEPGYSYKILMERYDRWPGMEEAPQDASMYGYRLIETLEKAQEQ